MPRFIERDPRPVRGPANGSYPINLDLEYRLTLYQRTYRGRGRTRTMSRDSVVFKSEEALPQGALVELAISWPVLLNNNTPLKLHVIGKTIRAYGIFSEVIIRRYEFRTVASRPLFDSCNILPFGARAAVAPYN